MKKLVLFLLIVFSLPALAQERSWYVAARSGLSIREKPDTKAAVLTKIPYGTKITVAYPEDIVLISTEGMEGAWAKTTFGGKTGYIVNSYLIPVTPPKATVKTMPEYFKQVSTVFGSPLVLKNGNVGIMEGEGWQLKKQFYKNGAEHHEFLGYEYNSNTYFLPEFTIQQTFVLLRLIPEFKDVLGEKDEFPSADKTFKRNEMEYSVKVEKEKIGESYWINRIKIEYAEGAVYNFELFQIDNQVVIFFGGGL